MGLCIPLFRLCPQSIEASVDGQRRLRPHGHRPRRRVDRRRLLGEPLRCIIHDDLRRIVNDNFRRAPVGGNLPSDPHGQSRESRLRRSSKLSSVGTPDDDGENRFRIRLVEVEEGGLPFGSGRVGRAGNDTVHGLDFAYMLCGLCGRNSIGGYARCGGETRHGACDE